MNIQSWLGADPRLGLGVHTTPSLPPVSSSVAAVPTSGCRGSWRGRSLAVSSGSEISKDSVLLCQLSVLKCFTTFQRFKPVLHMCAHVTVDLSNPNFAKAGKVYVGLHIYNIG